MTTVYVMELSGNRVKITDDRDSLPPDVKHVFTFIFPDSSPLDITAEIWERAGFNVERDE